MIKRLCNFREIKSKSSVNSNSIYTSNFTISHLETQDSGIYMCTVTVTGGDYVWQANANDCLSITLDQKKITGACYIHLIPSHPSTFIVCFNSFFV